MTESVHITLPLAGRAGLMRRRDFIALVGVVATAWPALGQQATRLPRVVYFTFGAGDPDLVKAYQQGLADHSYVDGKNIALEFEIAPTTADLPAYAARIVSSKPDIIVCWGSATTLAVQSATSTIPIVFLAVGDPVGIGLVASLARPGGNLTGNGGYIDEIAGKRVALLKEIVPAMKRIAVLYLPANPGNAVKAGHIRNAALAQGLEPVMIGFVDGQDLAPQFERVVAAGVQGAVLSGNVYFGDNRDLLWALLVKSKIPAMAEGRADSGTHLIEGLIGYDALNSATSRQGGDIVDYILKGVKPADIPVQRPTVFDFVVDLQAAKLVGVTISPVILSQATLVIE